MKSGSKRFSIYLTAPIALLIAGCSVNVSNPVPGGPVVRSYGGADGGGGEILLSSESDVREVVTTVMERDLRHALYNLALGKDEIREPYVALVLEAMFNDEVGKKGWADIQPIFDDIKKTRYAFVDTGGCQDETGAHHAGGVAERKLGAPICFSIPKLRLSTKDDLAGQVLGLAAHEFAHHFGFGELEAVKFQTYIKRVSKKILQITNDDFFVRFSKPLVFPEPLNSQGYRFDVKYLVQNGKISLADDRQTRAPGPYCLLSIRFDEGKVFAGTVSDSEMNLRAHSSSGEYSSDAGIGNVEYSLHVNPAFDGFVMRPTGAILKPVGEYGDEKKASLYSFTCGGPDFHTADLITIFGELGGIPLIFNQ